MWRFFFSLVRLIIKVILYPKIMLVIILILNRFLSFFGVDVSTGDAVYDVIVKRALFNRILSSLDVTDYISISL